MESYGFDKPSSFEKWIGKTTKKLVKKGVKSLKKAGKEVVNDFNKPAKLEFPTKNRR